MNRQTETRQAKLRKAYRLWKGFRTDSRQYKQLADSLGLHVFELNVECSHMHQAKHYPGVKKP